jgi:flagellar basal-body rod modification protein FlgD
MDSTVNGSTSAVDSLRIGQNQASTNNKLGQDTFLKLMVAQLQNQDPKKPMESGDFLGQLAQFSTVNGIQELQSSFSLLASSLQSSQALQASTMVGRSVLVPSAVVTLPQTDGVSGAVDLPESTGNLVVHVQDAKGQVVKSLNLGQQSAGLAHFRWDGLADGGGSLPPGQYKLTVEAGGEDKTAAYPMLLKAQVESVTLQSNGSPLLNLANIGPIGLDKVRQVM